MTMKCDRCKQDYDLVIYAGEDLCARCLKTELEQTDQDFLGIIEAIETLFESLAMMFPTVFKIQAVAEAKEGDDST
jgi:hypothetical protein